MYNTGEGQTYKAMWRLVPANGTLIDTMSHGVWNMRPDLVFRPVSVDELRPRVEKWTKGRITLAQTTNLCRRRLHHRGEWRDWLWITRKYRGNWDTSRAGTVIWQLVSCCYPWFWQNVTVYRCLIIINRSFESIIDKNHWLGAGWAIGCGNGEEMKIRVVPSLELKFNICSSHARHYSTLGNVH